METVIAIVALLFVLFMAVGVYAAVKVVGAAKRGVDRTIGQARRTVEDSTLRAKAYAQPGPAGELAQLRLRLRTTMRATQNSLHAKAAADESLKESLSLFQRLSAHGHALDDELKRLESEPDRIALTDRLPELRARTRRITDSADSLRWAARDRAHRFDDDDLDSLSAQIDVEAGALRHWEHEPEPPRRTAGPRTGPPPADPASSAASSGQTARPRSTDGSGTPGASWPAPPPPDGASTGDGQSRPDPSPRGTTRDPQDVTRPAIAPTVGRTGYPWQKKPRPESTT